MTVRTADALVRYAATASEGWRPLTRKEAEVQRVRKRMSGGRETRMRCAEGSAEEWAVARTAFGSSEVSRNFLIHSL